MMVVLVVEGIDLVLFEGRNFVNIHNNVNFTNIAFRKLFLPRLSLVGSCAISFRHFLPALNFLLPLTSSLIFPHPFLTLSLYLALIFCDIALMLCLLYLGLATLLVERVIYRMILYSYCLIVVLFCMLLILIPRCLFLL